MGNLLYYKLKIMYFFTLFHFFGVYLSITSCKISKAVLRKQVLFLFDSAKWVWPIFSYSSIPSTKLSMVSFKRLKGDESSTFPIVFFEFIYLSY